MFSYYTSLGAIVQNSDSGVRKLSNNNILLFKGVNFYLKCNSKLYYLLYYIILGYMMWSFMYIMLYFSITPLWFTPFCTVCLPLIKSLPSNKLVIKRRRTRMVFVLNPTHSTTNTQMSITNRNLSNKEIIPVTSSFSLVYSKTHIRRGLVSLTSKKVIGRPLIWRAFWSYRRNVERFLLWFTLFVMWTLTTYVPDQLTCSDWGIEDLSCLPIESPQKEHLVSSSGGSPNE